MVATVVPAGSELLLLYMQAVVVVVPANLPPVTEQVGLSLQAI
jgi:hypothetical protein